MFRGSKVNHCFAATGLFHMVKKTHTHLATFRNLFIYTSNTLINIEMYSKILCLPFNCRILCDLNLYCVVPENIQTPTTEGIGNSEGVGGSMAQEIPKGRGVLRPNSLPDGREND